MGGSTLHSSTHIVRLHRKRFSTYDLTAMASATRIVACIFHHSQFFLHLIRANPLLRRSHAESIKVEDRFNAVIRAPSERAADARQRYITAASGPKQRDAGAAIATLAGAGLEESSVSLTTFPLTVTESCQPFLWVRSRAASPACSSARRGELTHLYRIIPFYAPPQAKAVESSKKSGCCQVDNHGKTWRRGQI
jgi:hypothetical protein